MKDIRKNINYGRKMNRRLHSWNFRQLQFYIEYKAKLNGIPVVYVNPKGTSSYCPMCGGRLAPNGQWREKVCKKCNIVWNRDIVACLNLLKMWGAPFPPKVSELGCGERFSISYKFLNNYYREPERWCDERLLGNCRNFRLG